MKNPLVVFLVVFGVAVMVAVVALAAFFLGQVSKPSTHENSISGIFSPPLPTVPVNIQYRRSALGNGFVFRFTNTSYQELFCTITVRNSSMGKVYRLDLMPNGFKEIGTLQGWQAFPGDKCKIEADNFSPEIVEIPK